MASQANYFGQQPPPAIKKGNTPSTTTTESSSSSTKNGVKTTKTKYITTARTPTDLPDKDTDTVSQETREYNDGTKDEITLTRKVLGGKQYDIETVLRITVKDTGSKKTKTTYATPYEELDPVTGKPIAAFKRVTHGGQDHAKAPEGLAGMIATRAPEASDKTHNVTPVITGPGAPPAPSPAAAAMQAAGAATATSAPTPASAPVDSTGGGGTSSSTGGGGATTTTTTTAPAAPATTTTTTVVVEEEKGCCVIL